MRIRLLWPLGGDNMTRLIVSRLIQLPVILALIFVVTLTLAWWIPGNPLDQPEGKRPSKQIEEAMKRQWNMHSPWAFATSYLQSVAGGDLGPSMQYRDQTVNSILAAGLPVSAILGVAALMIALVVGLIAGVIGAIRPGSVLDLSSLMLALIGVSLPTFVTGSVLLVLFAGLLHWAPVGEWAYTPRHILLPAVTLAAAPAAYIARLTRLGLADVINSDYVRTARAKGLPAHRVLVKHAMKVAFLPVLSFLGPASAAALTGSFVVEQVFAIPGLGEHFVRAVQNKDQSLIIGVVLVFSTVLIGLNLLVDVAYAWIDPRIDLA